MLLVYVPGRIAQNKPSVVAALAEAGLEGLAGAPPQPPQPPQTHLCEQGGPDGQGGLFCWWPEAPRPGQKFFLPEYDGENQVWVAGPTAADQPPSYWLGWGKDAPPKPDELRRPNAVPGKAVALADGQVWELPIVAALPKRYGVDAAGQWTAQVRPEYAAYCGRAETLVGRLLAMDDGAGEREPLLVADVLAFVAESLAINYRLTPAVIGALGLLDDTVLMEAVTAPFELGKLAEWREDKKKETATPAGSSISPGEPGG